MNDDVAGEMHLMKLEDSDLKSKRGEYLDDTYIEGDTITTFGVGQNGRGPAFGGLSPKEYRKLLSKKVISVRKTTPTTTTRIVTTHETTTTTITETIITESGKPEKRSTTTTVETTPEMKKAAETIARRENYFDAPSLAHDLDAAFAAAMVSVRACIANAYGDRDVVLASAEDKDHALAALAAGDAHLDAASRAVDAAVASRAAVVAARAAARKDNDVAAAAVADWPIG